MRIKIASAIHAKKEKNIILNGYFQFSSRSYLRIHAVKIRDVAVTNKENITHAREIEI